MFWNLSFVLLYVQHNFDVSVRYSVKLDNPGQAKANLVDIVWHHALREKHLGILNNMQMETDSILESSGPKE